MSVIELVPALWVFWGWVAFSIVYVALGAAESRVEEAPVQSLARYRELHARRFGPRALAYIRAWSARSTGPISPPAS